MTRRRYNPELERNMRSHLGPRFRLNPEINARLEYEKHGDWFPVGTSNVIYPVINLALDGGMTRDTTGPDNDLIFQTAIDLLAEQGGGIIYIPEGAFPLHAGVQGASGVKIMGAGSQKTVLYKGENSLSPLISFVNPGGDIADIEIRDIGFTVEGAPGAKCVFIRAEADREVRDVFIRNVRMVNQEDDQASSCLYLGLKPKNVHLENCTFIGCPNPTTNDILHRGQYTVVIPNDEAQNGFDNDIHITGCKFYFGQGGCVFTGSSNEPAGVGPSVFMSHCLFTKQTMYGLKIYHGQGYSIHDNYFYDIKTYPSPAYHADNQAGGHAAEFGAVWLDTIYSDGNNLANRGVTTGFHHNRFSKIEGIALYIEDSTNQVITGNKISSVTYRTGPNASLKSADPTGFTSEGGVGIMVGKGINSQSFLTNNYVHYCDHAAIRVNHGFAPPFLDSSRSLDIVNNKLTRCKKFGIVIDGHFPYTVNVSGNRIEGDDESLPTTGIWLERSADQQNTLGVARLKCHENIVSGFASCLAKYYEITQPLPTSGNVLYLVGNDFRPTGTHAVVYRAANGFVSENNFYDKLFDFMRDDGTYNNIIIWGNSEEEFRRGFLVETKMNDRPIVLIPGSDLVDVRGSLDANGVLASDKAIVFPDDNLSTRTEITTEVVRGKRRLILRREVTRP